MQRAIKDRLSEFSSTKGKGSGMRIRKLGREGSGSRDSFEPEGTTSQTGRGKVIYGESRGGEGERGGGEGRSHNPMRTPTDQIRP